MKASTDTPALFQVSARKYRPKKFDAVVGQDHIVTTLKNAIARGEVGHAYLFAGIRGVGKTTCARIFAQAINCENAKETGGDPCGRCANCISYEKQNQFNIIELDAASNNSVENVREWVSEARVSPASGRYKVYIIDEAHMLSAQAFNAFLKTLEEPPPHAIFILATTEKQKIIPTILSRCQVLDFVTIPSHVIVENLEAICKKEGIECEEKDALEVIAEKADGSLRDALSIFDKVIAFSGDKLKMEDLRYTLHIIDDHHFLQFVEFFLKNKLPEALLLFDKLYRDGHQVDSILNGLSRCYRNLLVANDGATRGLLDVFQSMKQKYIDLAASCKMEYIISSMSIIHDAMIHIRLCDNKKYFMEYALMQLSYLSEAYAHTSSGNESVKRMASALALPIREARISTFKKRPPLPSAAKEMPNPTEKTGLYIEKNAREKIALSAEIDLPRNADDKKGLLEIVKERTRKNIQKSQEPLRLNDESFQELLNDFIAKHSSNLDLERALNILRENDFKINNEALQITAKLKNEFDKTIFEKELKNSLIFFLRDRLQKNIQIELIVEKRARAESRDEFLSSDDLIRKIAEVRPALYDFIKKIKGEISA